jgi:hypothetical protein
MYNLKLMKHKDAPMISVDVNFIDQALQQPTEEAQGAMLLQLFRGLKDQGYTTHDIENLKAIVNWVPPDEGIPLTEAVKWQKLAKRVNQLDEEREEGNLAINDFEADLIMKRLKDPRFKLMKIGTFLDFVIMFTETTGRNFDEVDPWSEEEETNA